MSYDLLLNPETNDLVIINRDLTFTTNKPDEVSQRVGFKLRTWQGEWFLDTTYGLPYIQEMIGVARSAKELDPIFLSAIRGIRGVNRIVTHKSYLDRRTRQYILDVSIAIQGGIIDVTFKSNPQLLYRHPTPDIPNVSIKTVPYNLYSDLRIDLWGDGTDLVGQLLTNREDEIVANTTIKLKFVKEVNGVVTNQIVNTTVKTDSKGQFFKWSLDTLLSEGLWVAYATSLVFHKDGSSRLTTTNSLPFWIRASDNQLNFYATTTGKSPNNVKFYGNLKSIYKSAMVAGSVVTFYATNIKTKESFTFNSIVKIDGTYSNEFHFEIGIYDVYATTDLKFMNGKTRKVTAPQRYRIDVKAPFIPKPFRTGRNRTGDYLYPVVLEVFEAGYSAPPDRVVDFNTKPFKNQTIVITEI